MALSIVTTTVLAATAAFTVGWIVARRKFVGRAFVAEEKYLQLLESCRRQVAATRTQIQALNDRVAVLNKHAWWGAQERRRLSGLLRFAMDTSLEPNGRPALLSHGFADTIPEAWHER
jgi:hypothetical protein